MEASQRPRLKSEPSGERFELTASKFLFHLRRAFLGVWKTPKGKANNSDQVKPTSRESHDTLLVTAGTAPPSKTTTLRVSLNSSLSLLLQFVYVKFSVQQN